MNNNCVVLVEIDGIVLHISRKIFIEFFWTQHWNIEANFMAQSKMMLFNQMDVTNMCKCK